MIMEIGNNKSRKISSVSHNLVQINQKVKVTVSLSPPDSDRYLRLGWVNFLLTFCTDCKPVSGNGIQ